MSEGTFDSPADYERMLGQGIQLSGEGRSFFIEGRLRTVARLLGPDARPRRILDFGCGTGEACHVLSGMFPDARIVGADSSRAALDWGRKRLPSPSITLVETKELDGLPPFDLCYLNGVMHHVPLRERRQLLRTLRRLLTPGGACAVFDNNPWSPAARLVMYRIPFDRDAVMVWPHSLCREMKAAGFEEVHPPRFLFVFPRALARLRSIERGLERIPLGAQYVVFARAGASTATP